MLPLSERQKVIQNIKRAGANGDLKQFTFLLLNNRISRKAAEKAYMQGQSLARYALNKETLTIETKGQKNEQKVEQLPTQKRT